MQHYRIQIGGTGSGGPGGGPGNGPGVVARVLFAIVAVLMLVAAAFLGAIFFLAALGVFVVGSLMLAVRIWWAKRQIEKAMKRGEMPGARRDTSQGPRQGDDRARSRPGAGRREDVIDGEYHVMDEERKPRDEASGREEKR